MKIVVTLAAMESWKTIFSDEVTVEVSDPKDFAGVKTAITAAVELARKNKVMDITNDRVVEIMQATAISKAVEEAETKVKANHAPTVDNYKLNAEIMELKRANKQKDCQLDGLIRGVNPDYVPNPDGIEPQDLR